MDKREIPYQEYGEYSTRRSDKHNNKISSYNNNKAKLDAAIPIKNVQIIIDSDQRAEYESTVPDTDNLNKIINKQEIKENYKTVDRNEKNIESVNKDYQPNPDTEISDLNHLQLQTISSTEKAKKQIFEGTSVAHGKTKREEFVLYEIGDPQIWYGTRLQLYEKLITPQGKTLWNDLTKEGMARVSTKNPDWQNEDLSVHLKPAEWVSRDDYTLPTQKLCLVVPVKNGEAKYGEFMIVPMDDVITVNDKNQIHKRNLKPNEYSNISEQDKALNYQIYRSVVVRTTRALKSNRSDLKLITRGSKHFLKMPHTRSHNAQIDIEARADSNELVLVGAYGRLMTIVSDSTRRTRSSLTVQATNMGLVAAPFRVVIRECNPVLKETARERNSFATPSTLIPPRHTQAFRLEVPLTIPIDRTQCIVALVNQDDEAVAVRSVKVKRNDRCFCVWHCDCVCLSEDPKLLCRSLPNAQQIAAGLPAQRASRHTRSVCYPDVVTINLFVTCVGVLFALFLLGLIKAFLGLIFRCVGSSGLYLLFQRPRTLERYYESSLRSRPVEYDKEGWPVHPDTKQRTVRLVAKPMEFILNLMFFIILPCVMFCDALRKIALLCQSIEGSEARSKKNDDKKCYSSHDVLQGFELLHRGRHRGLRKWMSPQAEELSNNVVQKGLTPDGCMRPLLQKKHCCEKNNKSCCMDSEQDDAEYIMMQMKKSKESLDRSGKP